MPMSVELGNRLETTVNKLVKNSRSEVLREGVRLVEGREKQLAKLNAALERGMADSRAGRVHSADEVLAAMRKRIEESAAAPRRSAREARLHERRPRGPR